jgi:hypothetical protein
MAIFSVEGSGLIQTGTLVSGAMTVKHTGAGRVFEIVNASCHSGRGYWNPKYNNWIIFAQFADQVLDEFGAAATRVEAS